jgi:redox-sensitive bicupin YhaK (pirin superfamily)
MARTNQKGDDVMITVRRSADRGQTEIEWLDSKHTFSFGDYHDPRAMGFRSLRVINEDRVRAGQGFGTHPHRDMEIISYVLEGELAHKDSMGNGSIIRPGEVQRMTAGTGVLHSEHNPSKSEGVHFLQIWLLPEKRNLQPGYEQKAFSTDERRGKLRLVAARDGRDGAVTIHQDALVYAGLLDAGQTVEHAIVPGRGAWVQVARGSVEANGVKLAQGDGAALEGEKSVRIAGGEAAEVLLFDLA